MIDRMQTQESKWEFYNPVHIVSGAGAAMDLPRQFRGDGRLLVITTPGFKRRGDLDRVLRTFAGRALFVSDEVTPNPDLRDLEAQLERLAASDVREILAIGGGSVLDSAKVFAVGLAGEKFSLRAYLLEGQPLPARRATRLVCVPTTAGTGSEVTPFATVWDLQTKKKLSLSGDVVFPDVAVLDPELTWSVPREVTVATGLDAITQAFEATWSRRANPVSMALAVQSIRLGLETLPKLQNRLDDKQLRSVMLNASLLAGLAISRSRTALCHSMSYPITAEFGVPHGLACGFTLPEVYAYNREIDAVRFEALASALGYADASALHARLLALMKELQVGAMLRAYVGNGAGLPLLAPRMLTPGRADNNLRDADVTAVADLLAAACRARGIEAA